MKQTTLAERARSARLRAEFANEKAAADAIGCSRPLVIAWENGSAKSIGGDFLLAAAKAYRVRPTWLSSGSGSDGFPWSEETGSHGHSQPVRLDHEIVRIVGVALNLRHKSDGGYNLADNPEEFVLAYELAAGMSDAYETPEVTDLGTRRAGMSPQGASEDEHRSEGAPANGAPGEGTGPGRRRKTQAAPGGRR